MFNKFSCFIFFVLPFLSFNLEAVDSKYEVIAVPFMEEIFGINEKGQVIGLNEEGTAAVIWDRNNGETFIVPPNDEMTSEFDVKGYNDLGQIVGTVSVFNELEEEDEDKAFIWDECNGFRYLPFSDVNGINNKGQILGSRFSENFESDSVFILHGDGFEQEIVIDNENYIFPLAINDQEQVLFVEVSLNFDSISPFIWKDGVVSEIPSEIMDLFPSAFNNKGELLGIVRFEKESSDDDVEEDAFLWKWSAESSFAMTKIEETIDDVEIYDMNDQGEAVGFFEEIYEEEKACFWDKQGKLQDLNDLIPQDSGWELSRAMKINNQGQIVGIGIKEDQKTVFLLNPKL